MTLIVLLAAGFVLAGLAPSLTRRMGRDAAWVLAAAFGAATAWIAAQGRGVLEGEPVLGELAWVPGVDLALVVRMDALGLLFALIVTGIGTAVFAYSARYFHPGDPQVGRVLALLAFFGASMLGLVVADDVLLLFVFWELTSVSSFFLIGGMGEGRAGATRAFLLTAVGGLALLAGFLLLGLDAGTLRLSAILAESALATSGLAPAIIALLLLGAFTKSAQVPFQFWLPGAMVAPTPISTYLHAATMVKAGVYLAFRMTPLYGDVALWRTSLLVFGLVTAVFGAAVALKKTDLKALLAYGTVSQLGFLIATIGIGTPLALAAAAAHTLAHALYKATLFMSVGIIDHETGSRDLTELGGLRRHLPGVALAGGLASLSMAGIPPLVGFVSKEEAFAAFAKAPGAPGLAPTVATVAVLASVLTFAYTARYYWRTFEGPSPAGLHAHPAPGAFVAVPLVTAVSGLALGLVVPLLDPLVNGVGLATTGTDPDLHLALWHGLTVPLAMSAVVVAGGLAAFLLRAPVERLQGRVRLALTGDEAFDRLYYGAIALGHRVGAPSASSSPAAYLTPILAVVVLLAGAAAAWPALEITGDPAASRAPDWVVIVLLATSIIAVDQARSRIGAVAALGFSGFIVAAWFVLLGAPDLALTQLLVETLTVAVVVLAFRRLPPTFVPAARPRRGLAIAAAAAVGGAFGLGAYALTGRRGLSEPGRWYLAEAEGETGGTNIVNTILVDFRALDTLGEVTVLVVAAIGIFAVVRLGVRVEGDTAVPSVVDGPAPDGDRQSS